MEIAIKSEADSRILVYPLIKCLCNHGSVAVYTSNKAFCRLIENELEGGFKDIRIVVDPEGDLDNIKETDDYYQGKYNYLIYDNVGSMSYDILIAILTNRISESYMQDLLFLAQDPKIHVMKFGKAATKPKDDKGKSSKGKKEEEAVDENYNKWYCEKTDEDMLHELLESKDAKWCAFPTYDAIELMESRHYMLIPDDGTIKEIYKLVKDAVQVDERQFLKGAKIKDESGSDISGADVW